MMIMSCLCLCLPMCAIQRDGKRSQSTQTNQSNQLFHNLASEFCECLLTQYDLLSPTIRVGNTSQVYFCEKNLAPSWPLIGELVANHELREDSFGPDTENSSAALFVNRDVLLESRGRLADYRRRDAAQSWCRWFRSCSRIGDRASSMHPPHISDPQAKGIRDTPLLCRVAPSTIRDRAPRADAGCWN